MVASVAGNKELLAAHIGTQGFGNGDGAVGLEMVFQEGIRHESLYQLDFGALLMSVTAKQVFFDIVPDGGVIDLSYKIEIENSAAGMVDYHLDIRAK